MNKTFFTQEDLLQVISQEDIEDNFVGHQFNGTTYHCSIEDNERFINPRTKKISNEEVWFAIYLELKNIEYETEPLFTIFRAIQTSYKKYRDTTYKPDFLLHIKGKKIRDSLTDHNIEWTNFTFNENGFATRKCKHCNYREEEHKPLYEEGRKIIVEVKGYIQKDKIFKYNVYDRRLKELYPEYEYYIVKWVGSHKQQTKTPYLYRQTPASMRVNNFDTLVLNRKDM